MVAEIDNKEQKTMINEKHLSDIISTNVDCYLSTVNDVTTEIFTVQQSQCMPDTAGAVIDTFKYTGSSFDCSRSADESCLDIHFRLHNRFKYDSSESSPQSEVTAR